MQPSALDRFYRTLTTILEQERPDAYRRPVTVAELYQDLVPYRRMRDAIGVELHADYEHALMRLLAGEHHGMRVEPDSAREDLEREIASEQPNLSVYRKYAACEVFVAPPEERPSNGDAPAPHVAQTSDPFSWPVPAAGPAAPADPVPGSTSPGESQACHYCGEALPGGRDVRYCPYCGGDQRQRPCPSCGEAIEPDWRFCVSCGSPIEP